MFFQNSLLARVGGVNLKNYLNLGLCDLALSCDNCSSLWLFDWLITHDMAFLSPQSTMSHNLSLKWSKSICQIFEKEKCYSWNLDKKSIYTLFGSRTYMFLDQEMIEKGIGIKWMKFRKKQPARKYRTCPVCGMSGAKRQSVPLRPIQCYLFPTSLADALLLT